MWIEERNDKYKYCERYKDPYTGQYKKVSLTLTSNSKQAQKHARIELEKRIEKILNKASAPMLLTELAEEYYAYKATFVKEVTIISSRCAFQSFLAIIGDVDIHKLDSYVLQRAIHTALAEKTHGYTKRGFGEIKRMLEYAERVGLIKDISFLHKIDIPKKTMTREQLIRSNSKFLDKMELKEALEKIYEINPAVSLMCEFQALTGLRYGEMIALRPCDYQDGIVDINATLTMYKGGKRIERSTPKNAYSYRKVELSTRAIEIIDFFLERCKALSILHKKPEYIFVNMNGTPYEMQFTNKILRRIDFHKHISTHTFRHTHISLLASQNVPIKAIMQRVGHNEPRTTLAIYTHVTEQMKEVTRNALQNLIE